MTTPEPDPVLYRTRSLGPIEAEDGGIMIDVEHVYVPGGNLSPCDWRHDPGTVGITLTDIGAGKSVSAVLVRDEALLLANRLTRAVNLILESYEQSADIEREMSRYGAPEREKRP